MSRTKHTTKHGVEFPAKTRKKLKDKKFFGYTDGAHSKSDKPNPQKLVDYVKYGYGKGVKKENKVKNYKKEIE